MRFGVGHSTELSHHFPHSVKFQSWPVLLAGDVTQGSPGGGSGGDAGSQSSGMTPGTDVQAIRSIPATSDGESITTCHNFTLPAAVLNHSVPKREDGH